MFSAVIAGKEIRDLRPLGQKALSKAGLISLTGYVLKQKVKIYSTFSEGQVRLRASMNQLPGQIYFPEIIAAENNIVVEKWIDGDGGLKAGKKGREQIYERIFNYLLDRSAVSPRYEVTSVDKSFDYLQYLSERIAPWMFINEIGNFHGNWVATKESNKSRMRRTVSHPDLSLANLVISKEDKNVYVVDNELLGIGFGGIVDYDNSALNGVVPNPDRHDNEFQKFHDATWELRLLGSALISSRLDDAMEIVRC